MLVTRLCFGCEYREKEKKAKLCPPLALTFARGASRWLGGASNWFHGALMYFHEAANLLRGAMNSLQGAIFSPRYSRRARCCSQIHWRALIWSADEPKDLFWAMSSAPFKGRCWKQKEEIINQKWLKRWRLVVLRTSRIKFNSHSIAHFHRLLLVYRRTPILTKTFLVLSPKWFPRALALGVFPLQIHWFSR